MKIINTSDWERERDGKREGKKRARVIKRGEREKREERDREGRKREGVGGGVGRMERSG